jgi:hypothetical protein
LLPRDHATGLAAYVAVIWIVALGMTAAGALARVVGRARRTSTHADEELSG